MSALAVLVDGLALPDAEAHDMWQRFSAYMEEHRGDLGGFAKSEGFVSAHPRSGVPGYLGAVLVLSRSAPQEAYGAVTKPSGGGGGKMRPKKR